MGDESRAMTRGALYARTYRCLFDGASFDVWLMYTSARDRYQRLDEVFDIPFYQAPACDEQFVDYARLEVKVCPQCLFASNDPALFHSGNPYVESVRPEPDVVQKVLAGTPLRRQLAGRARFDARDRSVEDALASYRLAAHSSCTLYDADHRTFAQEIVRAGNMALRAARLARESGRPEEHLAWLKIAFEYLQRAKEARLRGVALYKSLYQLAVVGILLGEDIVTSRAYEEMRKLSGSEPTKELHAYFNRLRRIWEDRDRHRVQPS